MLVDALVAQSFLFAGKELLRLWLLESRTSIAAVPWLTVSLLCCCASSGGALSRRAITGWWSNHGIFPPRLMESSFCFTSPLKRHDNVKTTVSKPFEKGHSDFINVRLLCRFKVRLTFTFDIVSFSCISLVGQSFRDLVYEFHRCNLDNVPPLHTSTTFHRFTAILISMIILFPISIPNTDDSRLVCAAVFYRVGSSSCKALLLVKYLSYLNQSLFVSNVII
jgi:hypothetical protein